MKPGVARCSILVLGEDAAQGAHETLTALAKKMFVFIDPACQTQHIRFEPPANEGARRALRGNLWKSEDPRDQPLRRDLIGYLATKLCEGPRSFVLFHIDGDRPWSAREEGENIQKFRNFIEREVLQFIELRRRRQAEARGGPPGVAANEHVPDMRHLLLAVPHYSIEAWLFQNIERAKELCMKNPRCRGVHVLLLESWARDRGALDEVVQPKEQLCFRGAHNRDLAGAGFPTEEVYGGGKSFTMAVDRLLECPTLLAAIEATHTS